MSASYDPDAEMKKTRAAIDTITAAFEAPTGDSIYARLGDAPLDQRPVSPKERQAAFRIVEGGIADG